MRQHLPMIATLLALAVAMAVAAVNAEKADASTAKPTKPVPAVDCVYMPDGNSKFCWAIDTNGTRCYWRSDQPLVCVK